MKIVLVNGPPRAGKDLFGALLQAKLSATGRWVEVLKFANPLKTAVHRALGLNPEPDAFEHLKDRRLPEFGGRTPREVYIAYSEKFVKPLFGDGWFGVQLGKEITASNPDVAIVTDSGFRGEAWELITQFGETRIRLCRLHRPGHTFENDSRSYITLPVRSQDVDNTGDENDLALRATELLPWILAD